VAEQESLIRSQALHACPVLEWLLCYFGFEKRMDVHSSTVAITGDRTWRINLRVAPAFKPQGVPAGCATSRSGNACPSVRAHQFRLYGVIGQFQFDFFLKELAPLHAGSKLRSQVIRDRSIDTQSYLIEERPHVVSPGVHDARQYIVEFGVCCIENNVSNFLYGGLPLLGIHTWVLVTPIASQTSRRCYGILLQSSDPSVRNATAKKRTITVNFFPRLRLLSGKQTGYSDCNSCNVTPRNRTQFFGIGQ
jgi:hypothetical protein